MLLDKLLSRVAVHADPFATCLLSSGWRLRLPGPPEAMFHFVLQGRGVLRGPDSQPHELERFSLAVVPKGSSHALECGQEVLSERTVEAPSSYEGVIRLVAGGAQSADLRVACGTVNVTYGDTLGLFC